MPSLILGVALSIAGCAAPTSPSLGPSVDLDPANPLVLNELAAAYVQRGDLDTAWLLLERASRLAPHDTRITHNLEALRAARAGTPLPQRRGAARPSQAVQPLPRIWAAP